MNLSIIIPCYNESGVIKKTISELKILKTEKGGPVYADPFYMRVQRNRI